MGRCTTVSWIQKRTTRESRFKSQDSISAQFVENGYRFRRGIAKQKLKNRKLACRTFSNSRSKRHELRNHNLLIVSDLSLSYVLQQRAGLRLSD
ncbi:hypothetical protein C8R44DRAFT_780527 [Mycena epipterygia]|nr:hypothetical protein C8R44DRAFT_780527 [Mycena epipterygia]